MSVSGGTLKEDLDNIYRHVQEEKVKQMESMVGKPEAQRIPLNELYIHPTYVEQLKLGQRIGRDEKRKLARKAKIKWDTYKILNWEYSRRVEQGLDPNTGKVIEEEETN